MKHRLLSQLQNAPPADPVHLGKSPDGCRQKTVPVKEVYASLLGVLPVKPIPGYILLYIAWIRTLYGLYTVEYERYYIFIYII